MSTITMKGVVRDGRLVIDEPIDLPEGVQVIVQVATDKLSGDEVDDWDNSPEGIAAWLEWYDSLQPLIFTDEERAALEADRRARKEWEQAHFDEYAESLRGLWE